MAPSRCGSLWQEGYHDRVLRDEEATTTVVRYMLENPVRAGLVDRPELYPFWGSLVWSRRELLELVQFGNPLG